LNVTNYYDSEGNLLKKYLKSPVQISAMASNRYVIKESDKSGGSGASFIVKWRSYHDVNVPIIESVMIGTQTQQGISFNSRGQVIKEESKQPSERRTGGQSFYAIYHLTRFKGGSETPLRF